MKFVGRDVDLGLIKNMFFKNPGACFVQAMQKTRQLTKCDEKFFKNGKSIYPTVLTLEITHKCNLRCETCWFWGKNGIYANGGKFEELTLEEIKKLIDSVKSFKPYILITGGEPLLYPKIEEVVQHCSDNGLFSGLITNGMLANEKRMKKILDAGLNFITVSIDGPTSEKHNRIRNNPNSFDRTINTLKILKKIKANKKFPTITINTTISKFNFNELDKMLKIAEECEADILQFQHQWFTTNAHSLAYSKWAEKNLDIKSDHIGSFETCAALDVDGETVYEKIKSVKEKAKIFVRTFPDLTKEETIKYYNGMEPVFTNRCIAPWYGAIIRPNGDVVPCIDYIIGNIKNQDFKEVWNSEKMKKFRRILKEQGRFPGCTRCCGYFQK